MNAIRSTQELNKRELELCTPPSASWHADYRHTAFVYVGGFPLTLTEGDILTIFSQYGTPTFVKLARDKETGKSKGFGWLKYEDQRSTDLAVDNLGGADVLGRKLRVDHAVYKAREGEEVVDNVDVDDGTAAGDETPPRGADARSDSERDERRAQRPRLKEEIELEKLQRELDDEDPMKEYLLQEKRKEAEEAVAAWTRENSQQNHERERKHRHHHRRPRDGERREHDRERRRPRESGDREEYDDRARRHHGQRHHSRRSRSPDKMELDRGSRHDEARSSRRDSHERRHGRDAR